MSTFGVMVNMSSVRSTESRRSRSDIGIERVCVDARLWEVDSDSRDERCLTEVRHGMDNGLHCLPPGETVVI